MANEKPREPGKAGSPTSFEVFARMSEMGDNALKLAPLSNIIEARKVKAGTKLTIGVGADIVGAIAFNQLVGGFIFCDKKRFEEVGAEMEAEREEPNAQR